jgi:hypothetical protein
LSWAFFRGPLRWLAALLDGGRLSRSLLSGTLRRLTPFLRGRRRWRTLLGGGRLRLRRALLGGTLRRLAALLTGWTLRLRRAFLSRSARCTGCTGRYRTAGGSLGPAPLRPIGTLGRFLLLRQNNALASVRCGNLGRRREQHECRNACTRQKLFLVHR